MTEPPRDRLTSGPVVNALGPAEQMRQMMGPFGPDNAMRQAVATVWRYLPEDARTIEGVEEKPGVFWSVRRKTCGRTSRRSAVRGSSGAMQAEVPLGSR